MAASSLPPAPAALGGPTAQKMRPRQPDYIGGQNAEPINSRSIERYGRAAAGGLTGMLGGAKLDAMSLSLPAAAAFPRRLPNGADSHIRRAHAHRPRRDERFVIEACFEARLDDLEVRREVEVAARTSCGVGYGGFPGAYTRAGRSVLGRIG